MKPEMEVVGVTTREPENFSRRDEKADEDFYARDRMVSHLDGTARSVLSGIIRDLVVEDGPVVLDLMASWDSHLPPGLNPSRVAGLGLNPRELYANPALTERVIHDLNKDPQLPFPDETFDVILNTVSVDYLVHPVEVFREAARVLKPGGLFLVTFSNRFFPEKVVKVWEEADEEERVVMVEEYFNHASAFHAPRVTVVQGLPRPEDDKYAGKGLPSDPIYAVYAEKKGAHSHRPRPEPDLSFLAAPDESEIALRKKEIKDTHLCPWCGSRLKKWKVPDSPFCEWDTDHMYLCMNDRCSYLVRGFRQMSKQGNCGLSYRLMWNPSNNCCYPAVVFSLNTFKDEVEDED